MPKPIETIAGIRRDRLEDFAAQQSARFVQSRPKTRAALAGGAAAYLDGVPMHWMKDWPMPLPLLVAEAPRRKADRYRRLRLDDFCLGDTGSMFGHSPAARRQGDPARRPAAASPTCCRPRPRSRRAAC